jgi:membrane dipeptidase
MAFALTLRRPLVKVAAMRTLILTAALMAAAGGPVGAQPIDPTVQARIDRILKRTLLIDGHNDLPWALRENYQSRVDGLASGGDRREKPLMTDIARLRSGRVGGQFWSVFITSTVTGDEAIRTTLEQIDIARRLIAAYPQDLQLASTADDIIRIHRDGKIASMLGIEGGGQIGGSMAALRQFHMLGVRYMTLTQNQTNDWADSGTDEPRHDGLSPFGLEVIREMNRLGMLVDLSHTSPATMKDAIVASRAPVLFSHSGAHGLNPHPRNVPDDVLRLLRANGGVAMATFVPSFLSGDHWDWVSRRSGEQARLKALYPHNTGDVEARLKRWMAANPRPRVTAAAVADHIDHMVRIAGHDHVGIGGDFEGVTFTVEDLDGVEDYPHLFAELIRRGWTDANLAKLAGGNLLRVLRQAESIAASMKGEPPSLATPGTAT